MQKKFVDIANIKVKAGNGGDGAVAFHRAKYIPKGGPDGGDGGRGGSVFMVADHNIFTLFDFKAKTSYVATSGVGGMGDKMKGSDGEDIYIKVPMGTLVYEIKNEEKLLVADFNEDKKTVLIAKGGGGGKGNDRFKSSTNQTPRQYTKGVKGEEKHLYMEVKVIADLGLIGMPNAGKSTLINVLTNAGARVANYPFTTISPNIGVCTLFPGIRIVIADIPGLIEGASDGKGLGDEFLRHVERTRVLLHIIDGEVLEEDADFISTLMTRYDVIQQELSKYIVDLTQKPKVVVVNKLDLQNTKDKFPAFAAAFNAKYDIIPLGISALTSEGILELKKALLKVLEENPRIVEYQPVAPVKVFTMANLPNKKVVYDASQVSEK